MRKVYKLEANSKTMTNLQKTNLFKVLPKLVQAEREIIIGETRRLLELGDTQKLVAEIALKHHQEFLDKGEDGYEEDLVEQFEDNIRSFIWMCKICKDIIELAESYGEIDKSYR